MAGSFPRCMGFFMLSQIAFLHLLVQLNGYVPVSVGLSEALRAVAVLREFKKGMALVERGKRQKLVWFMHSGSAKEVTTYDTVANGRVSWFFFASDFLFAYPGFFAGEPAASSIELLEDSVLLEMNYTDLLRLGESFGEITMVVEKIRAVQERARAIHACDLVSLSSKERYLKFFSAHKGLFNIARHKDIASYLGIKDDGFHRYW